jgi:endonuclease/exonuclease/phosphatase family metal-dependent hydrolase
VQTIAESVISSRIYFRKTHSFTLNNSLAKRLRTIWGEKFMRALLLGLAFCLGAYAEEISFLTYNTGLAHTFVAHAKERTPHLVMALRETQSDVLCLQEVWRPQDRKLLLEKLGDIYPHAHWTEAKQRQASRSPVCGPWELFGPGGFGSCLVGQCGGKQGDELTECVIKTCQKPMQDLKDSNPECVQAIAAQVGKTATASFLTLLNPFSHAGLFAFEGESGLLMLSKRPMAEKRVLELEPYSTQTRRAALVADVEASGESFTVTCTHLTANLSSVPYAGTMESWEKESYKQAEVLTEYLREQAGVPVLMGDMNCSPELSSYDIQSDFAKTCELIESMGLSDPFQNSNPSCTFCESNTLISGHGGGGEEENLLLDHVYLPTGLAAKSELVFDELVDLSVETETVKSNLSDHYGVLVTLPL